MNATNASQDWVGREVWLPLSHLIFVDNNANSPFFMQVWGFLLSLPQSEIFSKNLINECLAVKKSYREKNSWPVPPLPMLWSSPGSQLSSPLLSSAGTHPFPTVPGSSHEVLAAAYHLLSCTSYHLLITCLHSWHECLTKCLCWNTRCTDKGQTSFPPQAHKSTSLIESDLTFYQLRDLLPSLITHNNSVQSLA